MGLGLGLGLGLGIPLLLAIALIGVLAHKKSKIPSQAVKAVSAAVEVDKISATVGDPTDETAI